MTDVSHVNAWKAQKLKGIRTHSTGTCMEEDRLQGHPLVSSPCFSENTATRKHSQVFLLGSRLNTGFPKAKVYTQQRIYKERNCTADRRAQASLAKEATYNKLKFPWKAATTESSIVITDSPASVTDTRQC